MAYNGSNIPGSPQFAIVRGSLHCSGHRQSEAREYAGWLAYLLGGMRPVLASGF
jgi:hypothetical protein